MKKLFLSLLVALMAVSAQAQVTWNVRAGGGFTSEYNHDGDVIGCVRFIVQSNIPFTEDGRWVFSPTFSCAFGLGGSNAKKSNDFIFPLYVGYRVPVGRYVIFAPKLGPVFGFRPGKKDVKKIDFMKTGFIAGPSVELSFEIKHFVVALNGYCSFVRQKLYDDESLYKALDGKVLNEQQVDDLDYYVYSRNYKKDGCPLYSASLTLGYKF